MLFDTPSTLKKVEMRCHEAASASAQLLVFPEALLGGYPKGLTFGATVGNRTDEGREHFRRYSQAAIECPGPETETLASWAKELSLHIVIGVVERAGGTLYCSSLLFSPQQGLIAKHRKLMPTGSERLIWGLGDGSTMQVVDTESAGRTTCPYTGSTSTIRAFSFGVHPQWTRERYGSRVCVTLRMKGVVLC